MKQPLTDPQCFILLEHGEGSPYPPTFLPLLFWLSSRRDLLLLLDNLHHC